jgi:hypothetical protein
VPDLEEVGQGRESWGDVVIVNDSDHHGRPGYYALVRAVEWCAGPEAMTVWRGPDRPYETVSRDRLTEVSCHTVRIDKEGFYTCVPLEGRKKLFYPCPRIVEELETLVKQEAEELLEGEANDRAAEGWSQVTDDLNDDYEGEVWIMATSGDAVAVNGEASRQAMKPPRGWVLTDHGGHMPSGEEVEIDKEWLADPISHILSKKLKTTIDAWTVSRVLDQLWEKNYIYWNSSSGDVDVWVSKRAMRRLEKEQERLEKEREEKHVRAAVEARQRAVEERREKIRRGGWPEPKEWSPRGKMPGER